MLRRNAASAIHNRQFDPVVHSGGRQYDRSAVGCMPKRIREKILDDLIDPIGIPSLSPSGTIGVALRCRPGDPGERVFTITLTDSVNGVVARRPARGVIIDSRFGR
jgi:hypothetical protein